MFLDTECCRLLGRLKQSSLTLSFIKCKLESPEALGEGMRQNGGPTKLIIAGVGSFGSEWASVGSLGTNTKLKSIVLKEWMCLDSLRMSAELPAFSVQGLRRIEIEFDKFFAQWLFSPNAWPILWDILSSHPSVTTVRFHSTGVFDLTPIADALQNNFQITTIDCNKPNECKNLWDEHVQPLLKRNRKLFHLSRAYHLLRENPHLLAHVVDRRAVFDKALTMGWSRPLSSRRGGHFIKITLGLGTV
jgi:hypothetical protein